MSRYRVALSADFVRPDGRLAIPDFDLSDLSGADVEYFYLSPAPEERSREVEGAQLEEADALILLGNRFTRASVPESGRLAVVARFGVGYDTVDLAACSDNAIAVVITPDGPRGPRMRVKPGAIKAAQLSGMPIVAISGAVRWRRILGSWDRFCLALPFSRGLILWDEPLTVPRDADPTELERLRLRLEQRLNRLTAEADRRLGRAAVEPAAAPGAADHAGA